MLLYCLACEDVFSLLQWPRCAMNEAWSLLPFGRFSLATGLRRFSCRQVVQTLAEQYIHPSGHFDG